MTRRPAVDGSAAGPPPGDIPDFRPLYVQVRDLMVRRMVDGAWRPGEMLPSEPRLAGEFGVSQGTVRKALDDLAARNLMVRRQGRGTFVASHTAHRALFHFFHLVDKRGDRELPESRVLSLARQTATRDERAMLELAPGARVVRIRRVRELAGRPAIAERIAVPAATFPGLESGSPADLPNTLYELYEGRYGVTMARAVEHLRAVAATRRDAALLGMAPGAPLLEVSRVAMGLDHRPVEWRVSLCDTRDHRYLSVLD